MPDGPIGNLEAVVIDVSDFATAEAFWGGVSFGPSVTDQFRRATLPSGLRLVLQLVPERKATKNRVHLDVEVADLDEALGKVKALGGTQVRRLEQEGHDPLDICADPDGNEFCLVLSD